MPFLVSLQHKLSSGFGFSKLTTSGQRFAFSSVPGEWLVLW